MHYQINHAIVTASKTMCILQCHNISHHINIYERVLPRKSEKSRGRRTIRGSFPLPSESSLAQSEYKSKTTPCFSSPKRRHIIIYVCVVHNVNYEDRMLCILEWANLRRQRVCCRQQEAKQRERGATKTMASQPRRRNGNWGGGKRVQMQIGRASEKSPVGVGRLTSWRSKCHQQTLKFN